MRKTLQEIRDSYPEQKKYIDKTTNVFSRYFLRRLSVYTSWFFIRIGLSANAVSIIALAFGTTAAILFGLGTYWFVIMGAIALNLQSLLDCTDGMVARATGTVSPYGYYVDAIGDHTVSLIIPISLGIGLYFHPNTIFGIEIGGLFCLLLGFVHSNLRQFRTMVGYEFNYAHNFKRAEFLGIKGEVARLYKFIYITGSSLITGSRQALLICVILNAASIYLILWTLLLICELSLVLIKTLRYRGD